jgi:hypothetical protein
VQLALFTVLGACVMVIAYAFDVAGPVCALLFLGGVFTGALLRVAKPIIDWATAVAAAPIRLRGGVD